MIYALGSGMGHLQRALNLQERLGPCTILHQGPPTPGTIRLVDPTPAEVLERLQGAERLIVDTFPGGIGHELVQLPAHAVLVARYVQRENYVDYDALAARFPEIWLPYDVDASEWDEPPPGTWIGPITRTLTWTEEHVDLLVIGTGEPVAWTPLLQDAPRITGPFQCLPRARRIVALQGGYNLFWELRALTRTSSTRCAFQPLPRRYDDQYRRVGRFGTPLLHRDDLQRFLLESHP